MSPELLVELSLRGEVVLPSLANAPDALKARARRPRRVHALQPLKDTVRSHPVIARSLIVVVVPLSMPVNCALVPLNVAM